MSAAELRDPTFYFRILILFSFSLPLLPLIILYLAITPLVKNAEKKLLVAAEFIFERLPTT